MKKIGSLCLILMMVCVFSFGESAQIFGAGKTHGKTQKSTLKEMSRHLDSVKGKSPRKASPKTLKEAAKDSVPNEALVMFYETKKSMSKKQAKKALATGKDAVEDLEVEDLWTFPLKTELTTTSSGKKKFVHEGTGGKKYVRVALVKSKSLSTSALVKALNEQEDVKYAEPNYQIEATSVSQDPYSDFQWSMQNTEVAPNVSYEWNTKGVTGSEKIVAVVDTGVDYTHPDLKDNMWENDHWTALKGECGYDFIGGDSDPMDENGHGTHCAGIIGAAGNNGIGTCGVNQNIRIMALRILDEAGSASLSHEVAAYNYINKALDLGEPVVAINNSWGGGEYSNIFADLIDIVGQKGAITVVAAGNDGLDMDEYGDDEYPGCINSPYKIRVAATREDGKLVGFSNYGKKTVDIAAPGTDILSTVSYDCYNPSIYGEDQGEYSQKFNNYEEEGNWATVADLQENLYLNGEKYTGEKVSIERADEGFNVKGDGESSHAFSLQVNDLKESDLMVLSLPYEVSGSATMPPYLSAMFRGEVLNNGGDFLAGILDVPQGTAKDLDTLGYASLINGLYLYEDDYDNWYHLSGQTMYSDDSEQNASKQREILILLFALAPGSARISLDDIGLSIDDPEGGKPNFGKYDFMSGTSMATPYVTGAVALKAAELGDEVDPEVLVNEVVSIAREEDLPVIDGRSLDFRKRPAELGPRIKDVEVDPDKKTLIITGTGLMSSTGTKVELGDDEEHLTEAEIIGSDSNDRKLVVKDNAWINDVKTVKVTGYNGKKAFIYDTYLVHGKKEAKKKGTNPVSNPGAMATDGKKIYYTNSDEGAIQVVDPKHFDEGADTYATPRPKKIFKQKEDENAEYMMAFGQDLVYCGGKLYSVLEYGMCDESESSSEDDEDDFFFFFDDDDMPSGGKTIYSGEYRLISVTPDDGSGKVASLGKLPEELEKTANWSMAAYNGKLYFIGGYSYNKNERGLTTSVWVYDPLTKKWSRGPALPEKRAGGKALQTGNALVYTMGYSEAQSGVDLYDQKYPANLIFDGTTWKKSALPEEKALEPLDISDSIGSNGDKYLASSADISLVKGGLFYSGSPMLLYGDLFNYQTKKDAFADSGYNFIQELGDDELRGIAVGGTFYGFLGDNMYRVPVESGLVNVKANKPKNGRIKGAGAYVPGDTANVTVTANKDYRIKRLKVDGKAVALKKNQTSYRVKMKNLTSDRKVSVTFEKYKFTVTGKKTGKGKIKGTGSYLIGKTAKVKIRASKKWYIKSIKVGKKTIKVKGKAVKKTVKVKKDATVKVVFKKK